MRPNLTSAPVPPDRSLAVHPEHPAVVYVGLRLLVASLALVFTPVALVYKSLLLYVALEIFVLWKLRSMYPEWRGATLLHRSVPSVRAPHSLIAF